MKKQAKGPKFRVGQTVCIRGVRNQPQYGRVKKLPDWTGKWLVEFWDADNADTWEWDYEPKDLRPLTVREAGPARGRKR